jgi:hypothetical protein
MKIEELWPKLTAFYFKMNTPQLAAVGMVKKTS